MIGVLANEHVAPSLAFVYAWQVAPLHTRHFFNRQSLYHLLKQNLWLLLILQRQHYTFKASFMILISLTTQQRIYRRTLTHVLQWRTRENQQLTLVTWIFDTMMYVNGLNVNWVVLERIDTSQNPADHFTKNLPNYLSVRLF
jgi:hypothetical protein